MSDIYQLSDGLSNTRRSINQNGLHAFTCHAFTWIVTSSVMISAMIAPTISQAKSIEPYTAHYQFTVDNKYKGQATRKLHKAGNNWTYNVNARVAGIATAKQNSQFTLSGSKVKPSSAQTTYKVFGIGRTHKMAFTKNQVSSTYKGKTHQLPMKKQAYDDLSLEVQIRQDLLNNQFTGDYSMVMKEQIKQTPFKKIGHVKVTVPAGSFDTIRVDRDFGKKNNGRATTFWLAPSLDYLPIKVSHTEGGKKMLLELKNVD